MKINYTPSFFKVVNQVDFEAEQKHVCQKMSMKYMYSTLYIKKIQFSADVGIK